MNDKSMILIVDDEQDSLDVLLETIQSIAEIKADFQLADNGMDALEILRTEPIDLVLADILMPNMSGLEFMQQAGQEGKYQPFIFVTACQARDTAIQAIRLGAFDFIEKPILREKIEAPIKKALCVAHAYQKLEQELTHKVKDQDPNKIRDAVKEILKLRALKYQNRNCA